MLNISHTYSTNSIYTPQVTSITSQCNYLQSSATITVQGNDICLVAKANGTRKNIYRCDKDKDGVPDICDEDLDGDGKLNLLGIITQEKSDCSYDSTNTDAELLSKHFQHICSLDNAPFKSNTDQLDLNGDGIGDADTGFASTSIVNDSDNDGIPDAQDLCPTVHGMGSTSGCPDISACMQDLNTIGIISLSCNQCPCQFSDFSSDLTNGDEVKAILRDVKKTILFRYSKPRIINF